jgi:hypothetical protein
MNRRLSLVLVLCAFAVLSIGSPAVAQFLPGGGIDTTDPGLPPLTGKYLSPDDVHAMYSGMALSIVLKRLEHRPFAIEFKMPMGPDEMERFNSNLDGDVSINGGPDQPFHAQGFVDTKVYNKLADPIGPWQTEILSMNLVGSFGVLIRESPTLPSLGLTKVTDNLNGTYHIDSFFDVFTELSLDGGQNWIPSSSSVRVNLVPEPASVMLMVLGLFGMGGLTRRRK